MSDEPPLFHRHTIDYWLDKRLTGDDEERWEAIDGIRHLSLPETGIPLFLKTLRKDAYWRARALAAHAVFDLVIDPTDHDAMVAMLPPLHEFLNDPSEHVREQIEKTISLIRNWSV